MAGKSVGTIYAELDLDASKFSSAQKKILYDSQTFAINVENSWKVLGQKSDVMYNAMRQQAINAYENIKARAMSSATEILRAEEAKNAKIKSLNEQQFGSHMTMIDSIKKNWVAASAAIVASIALINRAMAYMDEGAKALQVGSSFKIMADSAGINSERLIAAMKKATKETIDDSDMMQKAVKLMTLGYDPSQIERFSKVVITASQIAGTTSAEAYDQLADAIANRMPKALIRMGAVTREQMEIVNKAIANGADEIALYELAMANLELKQKMLQGTQDNATLALQKFHAEMKNLKETIGQGLIIVIDAAYRAFEYLAAGVLGLVSAYARYRTLVYEVMGNEEKARANRDVANAAWLAREELVKKAGQAIFDESQAEERASTQEIANAKRKVDIQIEGLKKIAEKKKGTEDPYLKSLEEQYKRIIAAETDAYKAGKEYEKLDLKKQIDIDEKIKQSFLEIVKAEIDAYKAGKEYEKLDLIKQIKQTEELIKGFQKIAAAEEEGRKEDIAWEQAVAKRKSEMTIRAKEMMPGWQMEAGGISGNWNAMMKAQKDMLQIEMERIIRENELTGIYREQVELLYKMKQAEIEAVRTLNIPKLIDIGNQKAFIKYNEDLANQFSNLLPNSLEIFQNAFQNAFDANSFKDFFTDLSKGFKRLAEDIMFTIAKMEILKMLGYGGGGGIAGLFGGGTVSAAGLGLPTTPAGYGFGGPWAEGGYVTKPTIGLIGEKGPEFIIPEKKMKSGQSISINMPITISHDLKPFAAQLRRETEAFVDRRVKELSR